MTTAQIAELEADSKDTRLYIPATTLVRLLEERKQLLEAAYNGGLADAIAYAEEEAPCS